MSRTLYRPMFRRGGSTGEGITSGLRRGYADGSGAPGVSHRGMPTFNNSRSTESTFPTFPEIKLPKSTAGADFWLNLGTSILAQPGGRPILQTLGTAGKEPLARFQQQRGAEGQLKYQKALTDRSFMLEAWKAMNEDERIEMQKKARLAFENGDFDSYEEALSEFINASLYSKSGHYRPEVQKRITEEKEAETYAEKIKRIQDNLKDEVGEDVPDEWARHVSNFYDYAGENSDKYMIDNTQPYIDFMAGTSESFKFDDGGNIILGTDVVDNFIDPIGEISFIYVNPNNGKIYYKEKGNAKLVLINEDEEIISSE